MNQLSPELSTRFVIVTPVRDEEAFVEKTLECVIRQTVRPVEWAIVNDGSRDATGEILDRYARQYRWIRAVHRADRGARASGAGVMEAFSEGYRNLRCSVYEFVVKLDGDLSFEPDYFEKCFEEFRMAPRLGIGGGTICHLTDGALEIETQPRFHVRGATKIYRRACWDAIGGLPVATGWDTVDEIKANMLGWKTRSFENLRIVHHRRTGAADGAWKTAVKDGIADYVTGYHPLFMAAKCVKRIFRRPYLTRSVGLFYGFLSGYLKNLPRVEDRALIRYVRTQQLRRLLLLDSLWK